MKRPTVTKHFESYLASLQRAPLSDQSKRAYRSRISQFLNFLGASNGKIDRLIKDSREGACIPREYKRYLKRSRKFVPSSVNASLTAIDHFFQFLGMAPAKIDREDLALTPDEQKRYVSEAQTPNRALDRAVPLLLINTGIRIGECAALDIVDVSVAGRKSQIIVRNGKGDRYREVPLNEDARLAIRDWLLELNKRFEKIETDEALFLNPQGRRMSATSLDRRVRKIGGSLRNRPFGAHSPAYLPDESGAQRARSKFGGRNRWTQTTRNHPAIHIARLAIRNCSLC